MGGLLTSISDWVYMKKHTQKKLTHEQHEQIVSEFEKVLDPDDDDDLYTHN